MAVSIHTRPYLSPEEFAGRQARNRNEFSNPDQLESKYFILNKECTACHIDTKILNEALIKRFVYIAYSYYRDHLKCRNIAT